jgi:hypothetical protein
MEPKPERTPPIPTGRRPSRMMHNFSTFDSGHIGIVSVGDQPGPENVYWYVLDPIANNMKGRLLVSGRCDDTDTGIRNIQTAIMVIVSEFNPGRNVPAENCFDAPEVEEGVS